MKTPSPRTYPEPQLHPHNYPKWQQEQNQPEAMFPKHHFRPPTMTMAMNN